MRERIIVRRTSLVSVKWEVLLLGFDMAEDSNKLVFFDCLNLTKGMEVHEEGQTVALYDMP
jgi:hypothetical protein